MSPWSRTTSRLLLVSVLVAITALLLGRIIPPFGRVLFSVSASEIEAYDLVEITAQIPSPHAFNPFTGATIRGTFQLTGSGQRWQVEGFCDSDDGSVYRIRFMPSAPGDYTYSVEYQQGLSRTDYVSALHVTNGGRRGPIGIDPITGGILSGKEPVNTTSLTEQPPIG